MIYRCRSALHVCDAEGVMARALTEDVSLISCLSSGAPEKGPAVTWRALQGATMGGMRSTAMCFRRIAGYQSYCGESQCDTYFERKPINTVEPLEGH